MSDSKPSKVFYFDENDPEMQSAFENARETFRYFWRELSWEARRIVPALDLAAVKAPFWDGDRSRGPSEHSEVEQMWFNDIDFDGETVRGTLLNAPNQLTSVQAGDRVDVPFEGISDWMYAIQGEVYGAYTVNVIRARMGGRERREHDAAWGLNFGDPKKIRIVPEANAGGFFSRWFGKKTDPADEHPMSEAMVKSLREMLEASPSMLTDTDDRGWTLLHQQALAGNKAIVEVLLDLGADPEAVTDQGMTPLQLARRLGWKEVVRVLKAAG